MAADTNFKQADVDLQYYLIPLEDKDRVPDKYRKSGEFWGGVGSLWATGNNSSGALGLGNTTDMDSPVQVGSLTDWSKIALGGDPGGNHGFNIATKTDGTLWAWGDNTYGNLGLGDVTNRSSPVQVGTLTNWNNTAAGAAHIVATKTDGTLWAWGRNNNGQLGLNDATSRSSPVQVGSLTNWNNTAAGDAHAIAIKTDGTLWTWGFNTYGQLGLGNITHRSSPVQVGSLTNWSKVAAGSMHAIAIKTDGTLWAWGDNTYGQLGVGDRTNRSSPVQVGTLTNWNKVAAGDYFNIATKTDGTLWAWGDNLQGLQGGYLGLGDKSNRSSPVQVGSLTNWNKVAAGRYHSVATKTDGTLWAWGIDTGVFGSNIGPGMLGINDGTFASAESSPVQVGTYGVWSDVAAGPSHTVFIGYK